MARIEYKNDNTRALEEAEGSDGRLNVSSRTDGRGYYNSRDKGQAYAFHFNHPAGVNAENTFYMQNTSTDKTMVISTIRINATAAARVDIHKVTGTATGVASAPLNLNFASANDAVGVFYSEANGAIGGFTEVGEAIDDIQLSAFGTAEMKIEDRLRLGQNDAINLHIDTTATTSDVFGVVFFYYE